MNIIVVVLVLVHTIPPIYLLSVDGAGSLREAWGHGRLCWQLDADGAHIGFADCRDDHGSRGLPLAGHLCRG